MTKCNLNGIGGERVNWDSAEYKRLRSSDYWPQPTWRRHLFCKCCFFSEPTPSTPLNRSLRNFNSWRVSVGNRILRRDFLGPKTTYFRRLCNTMTTLRDNISGEEHDIDNQETPLETTKGPLHRPKISWTLAH